MNADVDEYLCEDVDQDVVDEKVSSKIFCFLQKRSGYSYRIENTVACVGNGEQVKGWHDD